MSLAGVVGRGRLAAEARMDSTCRIFYSTGRNALNLTTGVEGPVYANRATGVPCRIHPPQAAAAGETEVPGAGLSTRNDRTWSIPTAATAPHEGDYIELTAAGALTDSALVGKVFRIVDVGDASQATARRLRVQAEP